jgi:hypothetical protein
LIFVDFYFFVKLSVKLSEAQCPKQFVIHPKKI